MEKLTQDFLDSLKQGCLCLHPTDTLFYDLLQGYDGVLYLSLGRVIDVSVAAARLIFSGIYDELPGLKIITHHMGGMVPFYAGKIDLGFDQIFHGKTGENPVARKGNERWLVRTGTRKTNVRFSFLDGRFLWDETETPEGVAWFEANHTVPILRTLSSFNGERFEGQTWQRRRGRDE